MTSREERITVIREYPQKLREQIAGLSNDELMTQYIDGEWSIAQNIHHLADSHMNSFIRCKLILTEDKPTLRPYDQDAWAIQSDANYATVEDSLLLLTGLHARWTRLWESVTDWERKGFHPDIGDVTLDDQLRLYADHCHAHTQQIQAQLDAKAKL